MLGPHQSLLKAVLTSVGILFSCLCKVSILLRFRPRIRLVRLTFQLGRRRSDTEEKRPHNLALDFTRLPKAEGP